VSAAFAIDTNIAIYAFSTDDRRVKAMDLLRAGPKISVQLLNEFVTVSLRKRLIGWPEIEESLDIVTHLSASVRPLGYEVHDLARIIAQRYRLSFYDALIVAAARLDDCEALYSEDMQHGLIVDTSLTIINPFETSQ
jgi:predicted nucleic acid-binding protein